MRMRLTAGHGWKAQPHHKILVLDRGAVRLEYPETWVVAFGDDCVKVFDKQPPDDDCTLAVSYHHWPAIGRGLTVATLVRSALEADERPLTGCESVLEEDHGDLVLAWGEGSFIDAGERREARSRLCIARRAEIQALLTFDFWLADAARCDTHWCDVLSTLQLGQWVADPRRGPALP